jgi:hypothetical protein
MTTSAASQLRGRRPADLKQLQERRRRAARLFRKGVSQAKVARQLGSLPRPPAAGMPAG